MFVADTQAGFVFAHNSEGGTTAADTALFGLQRGVTADTALFELQGDVTAGTALFGVEGDVTFSSMACVLAMVLRPVDDLLLDTYVAVALAPCVGPAIDNFAFLFLLDTAFPQGEDFDCSLLWR